MRVAYARDLPPPASVFWSSTLIGIAGYAWAAAEALQTWTRLRRRLADRAATRRIGLWGAACACAVGMPPIAVAAISALGFIAALATFASLFPRPVRRGEAIDPAR